jgi:hypothetical protein
MSESSNKNINSNSGNQTEVKQDQRNPLIEQSTELGSMYINYKN